MASKTVWPSANWYSASREPEGRAKRLGARDGSLLCNRSAIFVSWSQMMKAHTRYEIRNNCSPGCKVCTDST